MKQYQRNIKIPFRGKTTQICNQDRQNVKYNFEETTLKLAIRIHNTSPVEHRTQITRRTHNPDKQAAIVKYNMLRWNTTKTNNSRQIRIHNTSPVEHRTQITRRTHNPDKQGSNSKI